MSQQSVFIVGGALRKTQRTVGGGSTGAGGVQDGAGKAWLALSRHDWAAVGGTIGLQLGAGQLNGTAHHW